MGPKLRMLAVVAMAALWGCFSAPSADVLFSCDRDDAPQCPPDYACEADGCCHRDGSDVEANMGACSPGASAGVASTATSGTSGTSDASSSGSGGTTSGSTSGSDSDSGSTSSTSSTSSSGDSTSSSDSSGA